MPHPLSDPATPEAHPGYDPNTGLCSVCRHSRKVRSARNSVFYLCELSEVDKRYAKYPRLPVAVCEGFQKEEE